MPKMSAKTEAALTTITLALIVANATDITEAGELTDEQLEALPGVGQPQIDALTRRGFLAKRKHILIEQAEGPYKGLPAGSIVIYSVAE